MKHKPSLKHLLSIGLLLILIASCSSRKDLVFANRQWHISDYYGQIIDNDTTYRMTFGNVLIPDPLPIISSSDSIAKYPEMHEFIRDILHTVHLDDAEILFYAPHMQTMFVRITGTLPPMRPSSVSVCMNDEKPYTTYVDDDDMEDWTRDSTEMYTYTYFDKKKRQLLIVDHFDYGDIPVAQITIFQSKNKTTERMRVHDNLRRPYFEIHDLRKYMRDIEWWSQNVVAVKAHAFANYKIGKEQKIKHTETLNQANN